MNTPKVNILICLFLLGLVILSGSACSVTKTNAQSSDNRTEAMRRESDEPTVPAYKPPKRVSKDIIKTEKKSEESSAPKQKAKK